jgi:pyruvate,water dikinase
MGEMSPGQEYILWFDEFGKEQRNMVGSKCANLGEMLKIGIQVPYGFAVTTHAYETFLAETGVGDQTKSFLAKNFPEGPKTVMDFEKMSNTISQFILSKEIPQGLKEFIYNAYDCLHQKCEIIDVPVAVRSSGVAEDLPNASFAGQYESYLNVQGKEEVIDNIKKCWASLFTPRAIAYQRKKGLETGGSIAVAVQKMINVRAAGVCFTVDPDDGDDTKIIIEGNWGVAEALVQGKVTPDRYVIDKGTLTVKEKKIHQKTVATVLAEKGKGIEERDLSPEKQNEPCITDQEAISIAENAKKVEMHYGSPQDIEWAVDQDLPLPQNIFLVQCRPVTAVVKKSLTDQILDSMISHMR